MAQIEKDHHGFRRLSYNKLRKTAGNLIRSEAGGEIAAVFLSHGTPVKKDELLDVYTNRPFGKVFEAIDHVGAKLRPLWAGVAEPFPSKLTNGGPNISRETIRRIQTLKGQGFKVIVIAQKLGVSPATVRRWVKRPTELKDIKDPL